MKEFKRQDMVISIHAPREGGDFPSCLPDLSSDISIHAPREGGDTKPPLIP